MPRTPLTTAFLTACFALSLGACGGGGDGGGAVVPPSYTLSGVVAHDGQGFPGVQVTLAGAADRSTTTDAMGVYSFSGLAAGAYTVTPSLVPAQTFDPPVKSVLLASSSTADFTLRDFAISGTVRMNLAGLAGVKVVLSGSSLSPVAASTRTDGSGVFAFSGLFNGDYTVTPSFEAQPSGTPQTFRPAFSSHTLSGADLVTLAFSMDTWTLSGRLLWTGGDYTGGGTVLLTGDTDLLAPIDGTGGFSFPGLANGTYTVRPVSPLQTVTPVIRVSPVGGADAPGCDFNLDTHAVSGRVLRDGAPYAGARVELAGAGGSTAFSGADGSYSFAGLLNGSYTVTPSVAGQTLTPASLIAAVLGADSTGNDFSLNTLSLSGRVTQNGAGIGGVTIALTGAGSGGTATGADGSWSFAGLPAGSYTVTPSLAGQSLSPGSRAVPAASGPVGNLDFSVETHAVGGRVTLNGASWAGTGTIRLAGPAAATVPIARGVWSAAGLPNGSYTAQASVAGQNLTPETLPITVADGDSPGNDFALVTWDISGVVTLRGSPLRFVKVNATDGSAIYSARAGENGDFSLSGLLNGDYLVAPEFPSQSFTPAMRPVTLAGGPAGGADFDIAAVTWHVAPGGATGDGLSWGRALIHPQDAVDIASSCDRIWVAGGVYTSPFPSSDAIPVLRMKTGLALFGGFAGNEATLGARDPAANPTVLDGDLGGGLRANHVVVGASRATLDGFTVTHGDGGDYEYAGAGMIIKSQLDWQVKNCVFDSNRVTWNGSTGSFGGGLYCNSSSGTIQSCTFTRNSASGSAGGSWGWSYNYPPYGGAVASRNTVSLSIIGCTFDANYFVGSSPSGRGGAVYADGSGQVAITGCDFTYNGRERASEGGALTIWNSPAQVMDCRFLGNGTPQSSQGGAVQIYSPSWRVGYSIFAGNAGGSGSALFSHYPGADAWVGNSLFYGNQSSGGSFGAINCQNSPVKIMNCTVASNTAATTTPTVSGGIQSTASNPANRPVVTNSILWGNSHAPFAGSSPLMSYSCVEGYAGTAPGVIHADPLLANASTGPLADFRLLPGSPCIDTGTNVPIPGWMISYDLDGNPRTRDGDRDGGPHLSDMGCYEVQ